MTLKRKVSFYCYLLVGLLTLGMSLIYLLSPRIMPYHLEVLGTRWEELSPGFQLMFLSMMKVAGALALAGTLGFLVILFIPFRRGESWARWAIPLCHAPSLIALNAAPINIALTTNAHPPLIIFFIGDILFFAGIFCSLEFKK